MINIIELIICLIKHNKCKKNYKEACLIFTSKWILRDNIKVKVNNTYYGNNYLKIKT